MLARVLLALAVLTLPFHMEAQAQEEAEAAVLVQRWPSYLPWSIAGTGLVVAGLGFAFSSFSSDNRESYDQQIGELCSAGCTSDEIPSAVAELRSRAEDQDTAATVSWIVGGATLVAGLTMVWLNTPRLEQPASSAFRITPTFTPGSTAPTGVMSAYHTAF